MTTLADLDLDPGIRRWIARLTELSPGIPDIDSADPLRQRLAARVLSDRLAVDFTLPIPDGVEITDHAVDGPGGRLTMRRYRSADAPRLAPTQLWLHGGGFYAGTIDEILNDRLCARRALQSGVQVFSLEYRLAPEHPYPAPELDAVAALRALVADPDGFGVDPERLGIGGNSAGAAIAASTALRLRGASGIRLHHADLEVPPLAMRRVGQAAIDYAVGFGLDQLEQVVALYTGPDGPADELISPLDVDDLTGLPPTLITVAEHDPLRDSGIEYAARLRDAGVPVELIVHAGHLHGTPGITAAFEGAADWQLSHDERIAGVYGARPTRTITPHPTH